MARTRAVVVQHHVVEAVVPVHDRDALLRGDAPGQFVADTLDESAVIDPLDLHLLVLAAPALELALDVAVVAREVTEPDRVDVDVVQRGQVSARWSPMARRVVATSKVASASGAVAQDMALDELHDVEGSFVDLLVGAQSRRWRATGMPDGAREPDEPVLAHHVVRGGEHVVRGGRRSAKAAPCASSTRIGEVGASAGDQCEGQRGRPAQVVDHPLGDLVLANALRCL